MKKTIYITIGVPASGKSSHCLEEKLHNKNIVLISSDEIRTFINGSAESQKNHKKVWAEFYRQIDDFMKSKTATECYLDSTNCKKADRVGLLAKLNSYREFLSVELFKEEGLECTLDLIGIYFNLSVEECLARNKSRDRVVPEEVILRMYDSLKTDPPRKNEGFNALDEFYF